MRRDVDTVEIAQMADDLARALAARVHTPGSCAGTWRSAADQTGPGGRAEPQLDLARIGDDL